MRYRKNVKDLLPAEKTAFVNAVIALKQKPSVLHPGNPLRSRYDDYAEIHMNAMMPEVGSPNSPTFKPGWAHNAPAFFPWHRKLILEFENDLANIDASVTLPYWDWPDSASSPFTVDFLGGDGTGQNQKVMDGPFAFDGPNHWTIRVKDGAGDADYLQRAFGQNSTAHNLPSAGQVADAVNNFSAYDGTPWHGSTNSFRSQVEYNLHNLVHRWVGGAMLKMTSPNDPVFFLHHCNIDRLWALWQQTFLGSTPYLPLSGAAVGHNLNDALIFNAPGDTAPWPGTVTPADCIDNLALGYTYSYASIPNPKFKDHANLSWVKILFGITNDAPGVYIGADGKIHHVPGGPGDPLWRSLTAKQRDAVLAKTLSQLAPLASTATAKQAIANISQKLGQTK